MSGEEIRELVDSGVFGDGENSKKPEVIETHISWVILGDEHAYKIKKPLRFSFLDFRSLSDRKHFCRREVELNRRFTDGVYLGVVSIREENGRWRLGGEAGRIVDYAVKMRKLDPDKRMDILLAAGGVSAADIDNCAVKIVDFHVGESPIADIDPLVIREDFDDLLSVKDIVRRHLGEEAARWIEEAVESSNDFVDSYGTLLQDRVSAGFYRDCHGDLHCGNIFILPEPVPFDCVEFNDQFRRIDVLNEVAFLCMDLEVAGHGEFSERFLQTYNRHFEVVRHDDDRRLLNYLKAYRANIRAKVNALAVHHASRKERKRKAEETTRTYLRTMRDFMRRT